MTKPATNASKKSADSADAAIKKLAGQLSDSFDLINDYFEKLRNNCDFNSSVIYLKAMEALLNNEEFCRSEKWVEYLKQQIEYMGYLLDDSNFEPFQAEKLRDKDVVDLHLENQRSKGGKTSSAFYRSIEQQIISRAKTLLDKPHDGRPYRYYRTSSLADAIISTTKNVQLPARSSVLKYLKKAVKSGVLPEFLSQGNPGKW